MDCVFSLKIKCPLIGWVAPGTPSRFAGQYPIFGQAKTRKAEGTTPVLEASSQVINWLGNCDSVTPKPPGVLSPTLEIG